VDELFDLLAQAGLHATERPKEGAPV
jgi:hypothetical protein